MRTLKLLFLLPLVLLLTGCPRCRPVYFNNGPLPEKALAYVPYKDGEVYKFRHSAGHIIRFTCSRFNQTAQTHCEECCSTVFNYMVNTTWLEPDYPLFNIQIDIANPDTSYLYCSAYLGAGFNIPVNPQDTILAQKTDSVFVDSTWYYDVFLLKSYPGDFLDLGEIYVDSLYYNYQNGILKIIMSNNETYTIFPDN